MKKHYALVALACIAFASVAVGTIFIPWLMVPLAICMIVLGFWVDELPYPHLSLITYVYDIASTFAVICCFVSAFINGSGGAAPTHPPTPEQAFLTLAAAFVVHLVYGQWLKPWLRNSRALKLWMDKRTMKQWSKNV